MKRKDSGRRNILAVETISIINEIAVTVVIVGGYVSTVNQDSNNHCNNNVSDLTAKVICHVNLVYWLLLMHCLWKLKSMQSYYNMWISENVAKKKKQSRVFLNNHLNLFMRPIIRLALVIAFWDDGMINSYIQLNSSITNEKKLLSGFFFKEV